MTKPVASNSPAPGANPSSLSLSWLLNEMVASKLVSPALVRQLVEPKVTAGASRPHPLVVIGATLAAAAGLFTLSVVTVALANRSDRGAAYRSRRDFEAAVRHVDRDYPEAKEWGGEAVMRGPEALDKLIEALEAHAPERPA